MTFNDSQDARPREQRLIVDHDAVATQLRREKNALEKAWRTRQLVMDSYIAMSKLHLPPQVYDTWFGEGGLMSDPSVMSDVSEPPRMQALPRA